MEIQSFLLCRSIFNTGVGDVYTADHIGIHNFYPLDGKFPLSFIMPFFILLRREQYEGDEPVTLRFDLVDQDGRNVGEPAGKREREWSLYSANCFEMADGRKFVAAYFTNAF